MMSSQSLINILGFKWMMCLHFEFTDTQMIRFYKTHSCCVVLRELCERPWDLLKLISSDFFFKQP